DHVPVVDVFFLPATIEPDPAISSQYAVAFNVAASNYYFGNNNLALSPGPNNGVDMPVYLADGTHAATINAPGDVPFAHIIVYGGNGPDQISLTGGLSVPALIFADGTLDASGSTANNVLIGQGGNDTLPGGGGRDLLIARTGAGSLTAGSGGDILIGGYTSYDSNIPALVAIMAEWGRTDADYNTRLSHLLGTISGGLNGSYFLNSKTAFDNGVTDVLDGGAGMDWFFGLTSGKNKDTIKNQTSGEVVTSI